MCDKSDNKTTVQNMIQSFELNSSFDANKIGKKIVTPKQTKKQNNHNQAVIKFGTKRNVQQTKHKKSVNHRWQSRISQSVFMFAIIFSSSFCLFYMRYDVQTIIALSVSSIIAFVFSIAFMASVAFRCVTALSMANITSQQGRVALLSIITGMLISGPVVSIMYNTNQVSVTISCLAKLAEQTGKANVEAYKEAYNDMTEALLDNVEVWRRVANGIQTALNPIKDGLNRVSESFNDAMNKVKDASKQCQSGVNDVYNNCNDRIGGAYENCRRQVPSVGGLAEDAKNFLKNPFGRKRRSARIKRDLNDVCKVIDIGNNVCEPFARLDMCKVMEVPKIITVDALEFGVRVFGDFAQLFNFEVNVDKESSGKHESTANGTDIRHRIRDQFTEKFATVLLVVSIIQIILVLPVIVVPIASFLYLRKFLNNRKNMKSKKWIKFVKQQKTRNNRNLMFKLIQLVTHVLLSLTIISFDYTLFWIESVVKNHGNATFTAEGEVRLAFETKGGPILKPFIDQFTKTFALERSHNFTFNTDRCLPDPTNPSGLTTVIPILLIYVCSLVFVFIDYYVQKKGSAIICHFYPESESVKSQILLNNVKNKIKAFNDNNTEKYYF